MTTYSKLTKDEERAFYGIKDAIVESCTFDGPADGESALKECEDLKVKDCYFNLRYPFWHVKNALIQNCEMTDKCRAALWYDDNITIENTKMYGIKALRECQNIKLIECDINSPEFLWRCKGVNVKDSKMNSEYPFFECENVEISGLKMSGKYSFQYVKGMIIKNSDLQTKDAFWHSENVTVMDSVVSGEYLGWYSKNLKFIRCHIVGTQPLCYCEGLVLEDCTMENTDLSFERSDVVATVKGRIEGVKNPKSGSISADEIGDLFIENKYVDPAKTVIKCGKIEKRS